MWGQDGGGNTLLREDRRSQSADCRLRDLLGAQSHHGFYVVKAEAASHTLVAVPGSLAALS